MVSMFGKMKRFLFKISNDNVFVNYKQSDLHSSNVYVKNVKNKLNTGFMKTQLFHL